MSAGDFGFTVDGEVEGRVRRAMDDGRYGSSRMGPELQTGVGPTGFVVSLAGRACAARIMESEAGLPGR